MIHDDVIRANAIARPRFRGVLHAWCFVASVPAGVGARVRRRRRGGRRSRPGSSRSAPRRCSASARCSTARPSTITAGTGSAASTMSASTSCIAGGFTPIGMLVLDGWQRVLLLVAGWVGASLRHRVALRPVPSALRDDERAVHHPRVELAADRAGHVARARRRTPFLWIAVGGLLYTVGALVVGARWPDPWPRTLRLPRDLAHVRRAGCHHPLHRDVGRDHPAWMRPVDGPGVGPHPEPWPDDDRLDPALLAAGDHRNVVDRYRYWRMEAIVADLDTRRFGYHVAVENWEHDFNIGTVVRNANAFAAAGGAHRGAAPLEPARRDGHRPVPARAPSRQRRGVRRLGRRRRPVDRRDRQHRRQRAHRVDAATRAVRAGVRPGGPGAVARDAGRVRR